MEDLAVLIASCIRTQSGEAPLVAGRAIVGGLLEFAVRDLEPEWFRRVLFARLDRMQADLASALDYAMLGVHADLAALLAYQEAADAGRFAALMSELGRVLDRLPPGPADERQVTVYLAALIRWLDTDPWPSDTRFAGPALTPAAIERKLRIVSDNGQVEQDLDADDLARQCIRLVIVGGPGSGKTWLARRTARLCAEAALDRLAAGALTDEVELPLYTTCARLSAAPPADDIRGAIVASALGQLPDLGGSRIIEALRMLFRERNAPTLLVADSLDEARGADDRIRQADTLPPAWRIMLTSRPASWNRQLAISRDDPYRRTGILRPLRYPDDVEPFITDWYRERPAWAVDLAGQLRERPALWQAATVPLILAFYCIIGGDHPLPSRRADLYAKVIRRMLTGRWRGGGDRDPDLDACLETLRGWAWSAATSDHQSGVGSWADEFPTPRIRTSQDDRDALDHVAPPLGPPDPDTGMTQRRFVHRSLQEHLVAEHVAMRMSAEEAASELLNHIWYDPNWEYSAPATVAMHPRRDQLLRELICRAAGTDHVPADISVIDAQGEFRGFLARIASETSEADWPHRTAEIIGQARVELARSARIYDLGGAESWATSNQQARQALLGLLSAETYGPSSAWLAFGIAQLNPTPEERRQVRETLLGLLASDQSWGFAALLDTMVQLAPTAEDQRQARKALLGLLGETSKWNAADVVRAVIRLHATAEDKREAREALLGKLSDDFDYLTAGTLVDAVVALASTAEDMRESRTALLEMLAHETDDLGAEHLVRGAIQLAPAAADKRHVREALFRLLSGQDGGGWISRQASGWMAADLVDGIVQLALTAGEKRHARETLRGLLTVHVTGTMAATVVANLVSGMCQLGLAAEDKREARDAVLKALAHETDAEVAAELGELICRLEPTPAEKRRAREALLTSLEHENGAGFPDQLAGLLIQLDPSAADKRQASAALLRLLTDRVGGWLVVDLPGRIAQLASAPDDKRQAREALIALLANPAYSAVAIHLAGGLIQLHPTAADMLRAREGLLGSLLSPIGILHAGQLVGALNQLDLTAPEKLRARETLLAHLAHLARWAYNPGAEMAQIVAAIAQLDPTAEDKRLARGVLLGDLAGQRFISGTQVRQLVDLVVELSPTAQEKSQVCGRLLEMLAERPGGLDTPRELMGGVAVLAATAEDKRHVREVLSGLLARETSSWIGKALADGLTRLEPAVSDLNTWHAWPMAPPGELLAAARQNSTLREWLAALPSLASLPLRTD